ncbi:hypothetical protein BC834DRAFT_833332, partial [Gloeopeniophorella convolvens]
CMVAIGMAILYYDHLLNLGDEVKFMWMRPMTKMKLLFIFHRYLANLACVHIFFDMMIVRVYALWDHRKRIFRVLLTAFAISNAFFDLFVLVLTIVNAAERPRLTNVKLISDLLRDGVISFLVRILPRLLVMALIIVIDYIPGLVPSVSSYYLSACLLLNARVCSLAHLESRCELDERCELQQADSAIRSDSTESIHPSPQCS